MSKRKLKTLFSHLEEGQDKIRAIVKDFYQRMSQDILIGHFFLGRDLDTIIRRQVDLVLFAMGAVDQYSGKSPQTAHLGLPPITKGHFDRRLVLLKQTLQDHGLSETDIQTWIQFENAFRKAIIQPKKPRSAPQS